MISRWQDALFAAARIVTFGALVATVGCGSSQEAGIETPSPEVQSIAQESPQGKKQTVQVSENSTHPLTVPSEPVVASRDIQAAREAFQVLITPGSETAAWEAAQQKLVSLGAGATPVLTEGLKSPRDMEREIAATVCAVSENIDARLQASLVKCLTDSSAFVRVNAAAALARFPEHQAPVMATLTDLLADTNPQLRRMAATNLSAFGPEASTELPKLTAVLADSDAEVVTPVIQLLGRIGPQAVDAVPQLQKIAFEQEGELKQAAQQALLLIQTDAANAAPDKSR